MKIERYHWHHYFGGIALLLLILQLLSGIFLTLFYLPELERAYASVQMLYKELPVGAWLRDAHRWVALALFGCIVVHIARSLLRKEFLNFDRRVVWLTGGLLLLPILALSVTGFILPWEWKGYWFMEMVPNHLGAIPLVGPTIKAFLIDAFTMSRNLVAHIIVFPVLALVLIEFHILARVRKRKGRLSGYLLKHLLIRLAAIARDRRSGLRLADADGGSRHPTHAPRRAPSSGGGMALPGAFASVPAFRGCHCAAVGDRAALGPVHFTDGTALFPRTRKEPEGKARAGDRADRR